MSEVGLVAGGFLAVPRGTRADWQSDHVPAQFISVSGCLTDVDHGPEFCAWHTDPAAAVRFLGALLVIGFTREDAAALVEAIEPDFRSGRGGIVPRSVPECLALLVDDEPWPDSAQLRGFEVIGIEWALSSFHSWLCHGYETEVAAAPDIRLNQWGLLDTYSQAIAVLAWMLDLPPEQAPEPVYWTVAAIAEDDRRHALSSGSAGS